MATVKVILWKTRKKENGNHGLYIRVTQFRKSIRLSLQKDIPAWAWDGHQVKGKYPGSTWLNNFLIHQTTTIQTVVMEAEKQRRPVTKKELAEALRGKTTISVLEFANDYLQKYNLPGRKRTHRHIKSKLSNLLDQGSQTMDFHYINRAFVDRLLGTLKSKGLNPNTIWGYFKVYRAFVNAAIRAGHLGENPFDDVRIKTEKTTKVPLTKNEVEKIRSIHPEPGTWEFHARNAFLFAFNTFGMRIGDLIRLRTDAVHGDRLIYRSGKSKDPFSIKLTTEALQIVKIYVNQSREFLFPFIKKDSENHVDTAATLIRRGLAGVAEKAGITKKVTTHTARHTVAQIAMEEDASDKLLQEILGHEDSRTTHGYTHGFSHKRLDELNLKITGAATPERV